MRNTIKKVTQAPLLGYPTGKCLLEGAEYDSMRLNSWQVALPGIWNRFVRFS
jgi:hypothetical protein